ncbi:MAG TPA: biopolymer transporter ExbD [Longimicrobiales bacterium]|nr:biopolymer transporter ExbD [Longimicrobiales bacterium]
MGISMGKTGRSEVADINMTPMIDVLLVLLVIFMIAQPLLQKSIDVQLPVDKPNQPSNPNNTQIVLEIGPDGGLKVNTKPVAKGELESFLRTLYTGRPDKVLFVKADDNVVYQDVIGAMDAARGAGVKVLGAVMQPMTAPGGA